MGKMAGHTEKSFYLADETIEKLHDAMAATGKPGHVLVDYALRQIFLQCRSQRGREALVDQINRIFPGTHAHRNPRRRPRGDE